MLCIRDTVNKIFYYLTPIFAFSHLCKESSRFHLPMTLMVLLHPMTNRLKFILAFDFEMSNFYEIIGVSILNLAIGFKTTIDVNMKYYELLSIHITPDHPWKNKVLNHSQKEPQRTHFFDKLAHLLKHCHI